MTTKKTKPKTITAARKISKTTAKNHIASRSAAISLPRRAGAGDSGSAVEAESAHGRIHDPSDLARDQHLRNDLAEEGGRSPTDRHRERLTAVEAEEDGVRDDDDDDENEADQREQAVSEQGSDDELS